MNDDTLVVVLGAGATRGCSFVKATDNPCLPPLDADFFTQLQRIPDKKHRKTISELMTDMVDLFGPNFSVSLETAFSTVEHSLRMLEVTGAERNLTSEDLQRMRERLLASIAHVMETSLMKRKKDKRQATQTPETCKHHLNLVERILRRRDHVISFNYDCVLDFALKADDGAKWNPRHGYGFDLGPRGTLLKGDGPWMPKNRAEKEETIHVHKLHGSLHFNVKPKPLKADSPKADAGVQHEVILKERPYTRQNGTQQFTIIPPESNKAYDEGVFARLWSNASRALAKARHIVVIGYSFPPTDLHSSALFRTAVKKGNLKSVVVVNPDRAARQRARTILQRGFSPATRVLSFEDFSEFLATDVSTWRG